MQLRRELRDASNPFELNKTTFRQYFRLSRDTVRFLINEISSEMNDPRNSKNIPKTVKIFTALQFYGHGSYQKIFGQDFFIPAIRF